MSKQPPRRPAGKNRPQPRKGRTAVAARGAKKQTDRTLLIIAGTVLAGICWAAGPETLGVACGVGAVEAGGIAAVASNAYGDHRCLELRWGAVPFEVGC